MSRALVTGGNGYLGAWVIDGLLRAGTEVRAVVRSLESAALLRDALRRRGTGDAGLDLAVADVAGGTGLAEAFTGAQEVYHLASPMQHNGTPEQIVVPARDSALHVLRAARDVGARRVVFTSSFAAVGYSPKPVRDYTEDDWTDPSTPGLPPYPLSKTVAERAAWDFMAREGGDMELVVINPTFIAGPTLTAELRSSLQLFKMLLDGSLDVLPRQRFGVADVRDVAGLHITAMATPRAAGRRYLALADGPTMTYLDIAQLLHDRLGALAERVTLREAPGDALPPLIIHNDRARQELGFRPRPAETTLLDTVTGLRDLGLLEGPA